LTNTTENKKPDFELTDRQKEAKKLVLSGKKYILLAGGSRSGKTAFFTYVIARRAFSKKSRHAILRFHFNDVKRSIGMDTLPKILELNNIPYTLNKSDWVFYIQRPDGTQSEIWLGGLDDKKRVEKILGNEYSTIYLNEASQVSFLAYTTALTRLAENAGLSNRMFIDCNPPEKSHWLYQMFVLKKQPETDHDLKKPELYAWMTMNPADNPHLSADYIRDALETLPERQKQRFLYGEWLDKRQGALWDVELIDKHRVSRPPSYLTYAGVAIDPAVTSNENSDETGIVWGGMDTTGNIYIMGDYSEKSSPYHWASVANKIYVEKSLDFIAGETNQGGDMVETTIRSVNQNVNYIGVRATRGKALRAEPVVAMYEQGKVHHVGNLPELESQMVEWSPVDMDSPDRLDALVWLVTVLMEKGKVSGIVPNEPTVSSGGFPNSFGATRPTNGLSRPPMFGGGWGR